MEKPLDPGICPHRQTKRYGPDHTICTRCHVLFYYIPTPPYQPRGAIRR
jgi:hypothetical protein